MERSSLLCPAPGGSGLADTTYTSFSPAGKSGAEAGAAELKPVVALPADEDEESAPEKQTKKEKAAEPKKKAAAEKPVLTVKEPGKPVSADTSAADAPRSSVRPPAGWHPAGQRSRPPRASGRLPGLLGVSCTAPDTEHWFPGASTAASHQDYVHLTNPDDTAAVADIELYGPDGAIESDVGEGITVPARSSVPMLISTLTSKAVDNLTVHVTTRTGRVGAVVRAADDKAGSDWLASSTDPAGTLVLPGIPADATSVQLVAFAPGRTTPM
ncbi:DUF5719 family protein [Streptomyces sp. M10(2022)]